MAAFNGKYEFVRDEGQLEHMLAVGLPENIAKGFLKERKISEISVNGNSISIVRTNGKSQNLILNEETSETDHKGHVFKNFATLNGDKLTVVSKDDKEEWKKEFSLNGSELTVTSLFAKPGVKDGRRIYRKL